MAKKKTNQILVQSVPPHFYRCGRKFTQEGTVLDLGDLCPEELERLKGESNLRISLMAPDGEPGSLKAGGESESPKADGEPADPKAGGSA